MLRGSVQVDTHRVHTTHHHGIEALLQLGLIDIMLILTDTDALRIYLHQLRQWVHQSTTDAHGTTYGDILVWELITGYLGGRIDGSSILAHHIDIHRMIELYLMEPVAGLTARRTIAHSHRLHLILAHHTLDGSGCLHSLAARRMREDNFVMDEVALRIQASGLATIGETRVNSHHSLLSERGCQEKLPQVVGKDHDGLLIRLLLAQCRKLGLDAWLQQTLEGIIYSLAHQGLALTISMYIMAFQLIRTLLVIGRDANTQDARCLTTTHRQQAMGTATLQRLREVEVIREALRLFLVLLLRHHLGGDDGTTTELTTDGIAALLILAHSLGDNVLGTLNSGIHISHLVAHKPLGSLHDVALTLQEEDLSQGFQALFTSYLGTSSAFRLIRQIDVFQFGGIPTVLDTFLERIGQFALFIDGLEDGFLSFRHLLQFLIGLSDSFDAHLVHVAGFLLTITRDERDGASLLQQRQCILHSLLFQLELGCNKLSKLIHKSFLVMSAKVQ